MKPILTTLLSLSLGAFVALAPAQGATKSPAKGNKAASASAKKAPAHKVAKGNTLATLHTDKGPIVLELYTKDTPVTAGNFVKLAKKGFYNGLAFHRVEPGFVIQGGDPYSRNMKDPQALAKVGTGGPGYTIKLEKSALKYKHDPGVLAMARTQDPDSAGSQFYVTLGRADFLNGQYAVFGKVLKGMDVAQKIRPGDKIKKVTLGK